MVVIRAMGMASSLGPLVPACAALRAGLSRPSPSPDTELALPGEERPRTATVYMLPVATFGFSGVGRLVALACEVLKDLWTRVDLPMLAPRAGLFLALPEPWERGLEPAGPEASEEQQLEALGTRVLEQSLLNLGLSWQGPRRFFGGGHTAFARALQAAQAELHRRTLQACVVAALDSLVEEPTLRSMEAQGRLKTPNNPVGLMPGEAGAALLLFNEPESRPAVAPVWLHAVALGQEPYPRGADKPAEGRALARCALEVLEAAGARGEQPLLLGDHNGEEFRAWEWGMLLLHLRARGTEWEGLRTWFPAVGLGDTGAASGAVATCVATRALQRGHAPCRLALVLSAADGPERAALLVERPPLAGT